MSFEKIFRGGDTLSREGDVCITYLVDRKFKDKEGYNVFSENKPPHSLIKILKIFKYNAREDINFRLKFRFKTFHYVSKSYTRKR